MSYQQQFGADYYCRDTADGRYLTTDNLMYYLFNFRGRICRSEYWFATIFVWFISFVVSVLTILISGLLIGSVQRLHTEADILAFFWQLGAGLVFLCGFTVVSIVVTYMLAIKRAHDRNRPGWFVLLSFVPLANIWIFIELSFLCGTEGDNPYGNDPRLRFGAPLPQQPGYDYTQSQAGNVGLQAQPTAGMGRTAPSTAMFRQQTVASDRGAYAGKGPVLVAVSGEYVGARIPIDGKGIVIGRDPDQCNLVMSSKDISRKHARISCVTAERKFLVEDLQSRNGVYIGRERVNGKVLISPGESFTLSEDAATFMVNFA